MVGRPAAAAAGGGGLILGDRQAQGHAGILGDRQAQGHAGKSVMILKIIPGTSSNTTSSSTGTSSLELRWSIYLAWADFSIYLLLLLLRTSMMIFTSISIVSYSSSLVL
jgi:hypothetical protein